MGFVFGGIIFLILIRWLFWCVESTLYAIGWSCNLYWKPNVSKQKPPVPSSGPIYKFSSPFWGASGLVCEAVFATKSDLGLVGAIRLFCPEYLLRQRDKPGLVLAKLLAVLQTASVRILKAPA